MSGCQPPRSSGLDGRANTVEQQCPVLFSCLVPLSRPDDFTTEGPGKSTAWGIFIDDGPQKPGWMKLLTRPLYPGGNGLPPISVAVCRLLEPAELYLPNGVAPGMAVVVLHGCYGASGHMSVGGRAALPNGGSRRS